MMLIYIKIYVKVVLANFESARKENDDTHPLYSIALSKRGFSVYDADVRKDICKKMLTHFVSVCGLHPFYYACLSFHPLKPA